MSRIFIYLSTILSFIIFSGCEKQEDKYNRLIEGYWRIVKANKRNWTGEDVLHRFQAIEYNFLSNGKVIMFNTEQSTADTGMYTIYYENEYDDDGNNTSNYYLDISYFDTSGVLDSYSHYSLQTLNKQKMKIVELFEDRRQDLFLILEKK